MIASQIFLLVSCVLLIAPLVLCHPFNYQEALREELERRAERARRRGLRPNPPLSSGERSRLIQVTGNQNLDYLGDEDVASAYAAVSTQQYGHDCFGHGHSSEESVHPTNSRPAPESTVASYENHDHSGEEQDHHHKVRQNGTTTEASSESDHEPEELPNTTQHEATTPKAEGDGTTVGQVMEENSTTEASTTNQTEPASNEIIEDHTDHSTATEPVMSSTETPAPVVMNMETTSEKAIDRPSCAYWETIKSSPCCRGGRFVRRRCVKGADCDQGCEGPEGFRETCSCGGAFHCINDWCAHITA